MTWTPQRIVLIARGRYDEGHLASDAYPGMMLAKNSSGNLIPHNLIGGGGPLRVAIEDALRGADITQKLNSGDDGVPYYYPAKGDLFLMLLQNGQNVAQQTPLMSAGDGTLISAPGQVLYEILAPSSTITNVTAETTFSNGTYSIPAGFLSVGDRLHIRAKAFCIAQNSTNTHDVKMYMGSTNIGDSTAVQLAANDVVIFDIYLTIRTIGASGTWIADGFTTRSVSGTFTVLPITVASTAIDTTAANAITVKSTASAQSTGNQIRLDEFQVDLFQDSSDVGVVYAAEACDNSAGTGTSGFNSAKFVRCQVV